MARSLTLDACAQIILGLRPAEPDHQVFRDLFDAFVHATRIPSPVRHAYPAYWRGIRAARDLRALLYRRITSIRRAPGTDVLSHLIAGTEASGSVQAGLSDHLLALLIAARETMASLITWSLIELASGNAAREGVRKDAPAVLSQPHLLLGLSAAPHLQATLLETGRLHSPNVISMRTAVADCTIGEHRIPRGWHVAYSPSANHLMGHLYPDPMTFRPGRFAGERRASAVNLLTFGGGVHACPGKRLAELLAGAAVSSVMAAHRLTLTGGAPREVRHLPVKAPAEPALVTLEAA